MEVEVSVSIKVVMVTKGAGYVSFTEASRWVPLYLSKSIICMAPLYW